MHSENFDDCQLCVDIIQGMIDDFNAEGLTDLSKIFIMNKKWALEHLEVLQDYGRYPHRNKVLGRESTEKEELYLRDASSFGQR